MTPRPSSQSVPAPAQRDAAREAVRQYALAAPNEPGPVIDQADLDHDDEHYAKAIASLTELLRTKPIGTSLPLVYQQLAANYKELGDIDAADEAWRRRVELDPKNPWVHGNYSSFLFTDAGDIPHAIDEARAALALMDYGMARGCLADALAERGNMTLWSFGGPDDATRDYDEALKLAPNSRIAHYGLAAVYRQRALRDHDLHALAPARAELNKVLTLDPKWSDAKRALAELDEVEAWLNANKK